MILVRNRVYYSPHNAAHIPTSSPGYCKITASEWIIKVKLDVNMDVLEATLATYLAYYTIYGRLHSTDDTFESNVW